MSMQEQEARNSARGVFIVRLSPHFGSSTERRMRNSGIVNDCGKKLQVGDYNTLQGEDEEPWTAEK